MNDLSARFPEAHSSPAQIALDAARMMDVCLDAARRAREVHPFQYQSDGTAPYNPAREETYWQFVEEAMRAEGLPFSMLPAKRRLALTPVRGEAA
jgi:hypothetical protein